jgi:hypothetical protein
MCASRGTLQCGWRRPLPLPLPLIAEEPAVEAASTEGLKGKLVSDAEMSEARVAPPGPPIGYHPDQPLVGSK